MSSIPPNSLFHALLRPAILQILRAAGYHSARTSVLDALTDLAARYFFHLCQLTALYASHNHPPSLLPPPPSIIDVRMALQRAGALLPERVEEEQDFFGAEDMRGTEEFLAWAAGPVNREIKRVALGGEDEGRDYLDGEFLLPLMIVCVGGADHLGQRSRRSIARMTMTGASLRGRCWAGGMSMGRCRWRGARCRVLMIGRRGCRRGRRGRRRRWWRRRRRGR